MIAVVNVLITSIVAICKITLKPNIQVFFTTLNLIIGREQQVLS